MEDVRFAVALSCVPEVGCVSFRAAVERHGSASAAFAQDVEAAQRERALVAADRILQSAHRTGARVLVLGEREYPQALMDLNDPPSILFALGSVDALHLPSVAIVGARHASPSGVRTARRLAQALARAGAPVVSGMARGVDAAAHRGALDAGGLTVAVLGGGVDVIYPAAHRELYEAIAERGAVISEVPPGTRPLPGAFPRRNRIIAALARLTIVVEAGDRSGALKTAEHALELGRGLGAVPGPIDAAQCAGSNNLLRHGAIFIGCEDDALLAAGITPSVGTALPDETDWASSPGAGDVITPGSRMSPGSGSVPSRAIMTDPASGSTGCEEPSHGALLGSRRNGEQASMLVSRRAVESTDARAVLSAMRAGAEDASSIARSTGLSARTVAALLATLELTGRVWTDHAGATRETR